MAWTFSKNVNIKQHNFSKSKSGSATGGNAPFPLAPHHLPHTHTHTFLCSENKKGKQRKKRKSFKAETIKRLSPKSKCYCFSHSRASRIQKFFLPANHGGRQYFSVSWSLHFEIRFIGPKKDTACSLYYFFVFTFLSF